MNNDDDKTGSPPSHNSEDDLDPYNQPERPYVYRWQSNRGPEPLPSEMSTRNEAIAIKTLIKEKLLVYQEPERTCPIVRLIDEAGEFTNDVGYLYYDFPKLGRIGISVPEAQVLADSIERFREDLLLNVGSDVVSGTMFALNVDDESKYFGLDPTKSEKENSKIPSPYDDPGSAFSPDEIATTSFTITAQNANTKIKKSFRFPITNHDADQLISSGHPSKFGISGKGDHLDEKVRSSFEYSASELDLPPWLHHPR